MKKSQNHKPEDFGSEKGKKDLSSSGSDTIRPVLKISSGSDTIQQALIEEMQEKCIKNYGINLPHKIAKELIEKALSKQKKKFKEMIEEIYNYVAKLPETVEHLRIYYKLRELLQKLEERK